MNYLREELNDPVIVIFLLGALCIFTAIVGGGIKIAGYEISIIKEKWQQVFTCIIRLIGAPGGNARKRKDPSKIRVGRLVPRGLFQGSAECGADKGGETLARALAPQSVLLPTGVSAVLNLALAHFVWRPLCPASDSEGRSGGRADGVDSPRTLFLFLATVR